MEDHITYRKWIFYILIVVFALYWLSNLILWFPWTIAAWLGMTLMLTVSPLIWGFGIYKALAGFPGRDLMKAAIIVAVVFTMFSVASDHVFFVWIRNAQEQLYHPTTFYGYAFLFSLPFIESLFLRKQIDRNKTGLTNKDFLFPALLGVISLSAVMLLAGIY